MPFFGGKKKKEKEAEGCINYPRQITPPPAPPSPMANVPLHPSQQVYPQGALVQNPHYNVVMVQRVAESNSPSGWFDRMFDGPEFKNAIPDPRIPKAPGTFAIIQPTSYYGCSINQPSLATPSAPCSSSSFPSSSNNPPPPSYEDVLAQEIKKKL